MSKLAPKIKMKIRTAVTDYIRMFPDDYKKVSLYCDYVRNNLKTDLAEIPETRGAGDWRSLYIISEKLSQMIGMKLTLEELTEFKSDDANDYWFAKEFPQFRITSSV